MIEFTQTGLDLTLDTDDLVQFSRDTPVQVTLSDDTFADADNLSLNFIPEDGRTRNPARVELTQSATDSTVYTGVIGKAAALKAGSTAVSLGGIVTATGQVINSRAERVTIDRSVDPEATPVPDSESLAGLIRTAVDNYAGEHGITTGATADEAAQIEQNTVKIAALNNDFAVCNYAVFADNATAYRLDTDPIATGTSVSYSGVKIECQPGDQFEIKAVGGLNYRLYAFVDSDGIRLSHSNGTAEGNNSYDSPVTVTAPDGAVYLYCNINTSYTDSYIINCPEWFESVPELQNAATDLENRILELENFEANVYQYGGLPWKIGALSVDNGGIITSDTQAIYTYRFIPAAKGSRIKFDTSMTRWWVAEYSTNNQVHCLNSPGSWTYGAGVYTVQSDECKYIRITIKDISGNLMLGDQVGFSIVDPQDIRSTIVLPQMPEIHAVIDTVPLNSSTALTLTEIYAHYDALVDAYPDYITKTNLGKDASGQYDIYRYDFSPSLVPTEGFISYGRNYSADDYPTIIMDACIHGEEKPCARALANLMSLIAGATKNDILGYLRRNVHFVIIPVVNPWGYVNSTRYNANHVDLNRNFTPYWEEGSDDITDDRYRGSEALSEPETQYIQSIFDEYRHIAVAYYGWHTHGVFSAYEYMTAFSVGTYLTDPMVMIGYDVIQSITSSGHINHNLSADSGYIGTLMYSTTELSGKAVLAASEAGIAAAAPELLYRYYDGGTATVYNDDTNALNAECVLYAIGNAVKTFAC